MTICSQSKTCTVVSKADCSGDRCYSEPGEGDEIALGPHIEEKTLHPSSNDGSLPNSERLHDIPSSQQSLDCPDADPEKGNPHLDHCVLKFSGSNCPGCTGEITKALESTASVSNLRMNQVLLQADFDHDSAKGSKASLLRSIQKRTGRQCEFVENKLRDLEVNVLDNSTKLTKSMLPTGVQSIRRLSKDTYAIRYDAKTLRARNLLKAMSIAMNCAVCLAPPKSDKGLPAELRKAAYLTCLSSILTLPILILAWAPLPEHEKIYQSISLVLATIIQVVVAGPFYPRALRGLFLSRVIEVDLLVVLSTSIAYGFSVASFIGQVMNIQLALGVYFETCALLITLIMVGRLIGDLACHRAIRSTSVKSLRQKFTTLVNGSDLPLTKEAEIDTRLLHYGDIIQVRPGCSVVTDGTIVSGASEFDESVMTGETRLVTKFMGSTVIAGAINCGGTALVQVTRLPGENALDEIARVVEEVMHSKPRTQQVADRIATWIVPGAATLALLTLITWFVVGEFVEHLSAERAILKAVPYAISVLVVSCPCAIGMAVPIVLMVGGAVGKHHGVIFRTAEAMMLARRATHVVFDSTGTLTERSLSFVTANYLKEDINLANSLVLGLTRLSQHPVSAAVARQVESKGHIEPASVTNCKTVVGKGVEALWNGKLVRIGNAQWLGAEALPEVQTLLSRNLTVLCVSVQGQTLASFGLQTHLRYDARPVVARLRSRGIEVSIVSGNETGAVHQVAVDLGIPVANVLTRCTPIEKQQYVKKLMQPAYNSSNNKNNSNENVIIFCGDGINDEAALAQASIGLRLGKGNNNNNAMIQTAANAFLTGSSLTGLLTLIELSRHCHRQIMFNFTWAAIYNIFAILLASGAFVRFRLPPEYAGLGEAVSILPVILMPMHLWRRDFSWR